MLVQLGYEVTDLTKDPGKEKYSVKLTSNGLNVPIAVEISANTKYIWLTAFLGPADSTNGSKCFALLKQNFIAQPCQFYVTEKGNLMFGLPVENKGVTNAWLKDRLESVANKIGESKTIWQ